MRITAERIADTTYRPLLAQALRNQWCRISLRVPSQRRPIIPRLQLLDSRLRSRGEFYPEPPLLIPGSRRRTAIVFLPDTSLDVQLDLFGADEPPETIELRVRPLSRNLAALRIALRHPFHVLHAFRGGLRGAFGRFRTELAILATGTAPSSYQRWIELFDTWSPRDLRRLHDSPRRGHWPAIAAVVCATGANAADALQQSDALRATLESLGQQTLRPSRTIITGNSPSTVLADGDAPYVALLQAGEVLAPHALAVLADEAVRLGQPDAVYADDDALTPEGARATPHFKPQPNHLLMLSGTLSRGVWLVRRELLAQDHARDLQHAEALRLALWLDLYVRDNARATHRVPYILTHLRADAEHAPAEALADVVRRHMDEVRVPAHVEPGTPLQVQLEPQTRHTDKVSIIVPSTCRSPHVLRCLHAVLERTEYTKFELLLVVSQALPLDARQQATIDALTADSRVRCIVHSAATFNYSAANNYAANLADGPFLCLLNDDVEPTDAAWLGLMVAHFADPRVGIVGAKLCYPNGLVQHGGIIMGLAGLAEHANRFRRSEDPSYSWRGVLDQELSGVTGACLLVRRELYQSIGGMDESFPATFNDVDFCLRVREAGYAVVLSNQSELVHYESLSFGKRVSGEAAQRQEQDADRIRERWSDVVAADPFHNPNLSLQRGKEWALAFPVRVGKPPVATEPASP